MSTPPRQPLVPGIADRAVWEKITKGRAGIRWDNVVETKMEVLRGRPTRGTVYREDWRLQDKVKERIEERERLALRNKMKEEKHLEIYRGLREDIGMKTYLHDPKGYAKKIKTAISCRDLDVPERRKRYTSSREEEDMATNMCPCGATINSRTHVIG